MLGPKESKELYPLLNVDDLYGTLHSPGDGTVDPASWATTLSRAAMKNGGKVWLISFSISLHLHNNRDQPFMRFSPSSAVNFIDIITFDL